MAEPEVDKKLEGRLFDLLEVRAKIRLGQLVQLRRRSRARGITLLLAAVEAGQLDTDLAREIAQAAGLESATSPPPRHQTDEFDSLPQIGPNEHDDLDDSIVDSEPPEFEEHHGGGVIDDRPTAQMDSGMFADLSGVPGPGQSPPVPPVVTPRPGGPPPLPALRPPPPLPMPAPVGAAPPMPIADRKTEIDPPRKMGSQPPGLPQPRPLAPPVLKRPPNAPSPRAPRPRPVGPGARVGAPPAGPSKTEGGRRITPKAPPLVKQPAVVQTRPQQEVLLEASALVAQEKQTIANSRDTPWGDTEPPTGPAGSSSDMAADELLGSMPAGSDARYALGRELGRGGMGQVLEAQDMALERPVALKLLIEQDDPSLRVRFVDEARVTGQLQHPSVPPVYEFGKLGDGRLFFAMKRIEGRTLRDVIEDLRSGEAEAEKTFGRVRLLRVFGRVCRAIAYAHSRGVMHRDLKPENIMLGEFGEVTVMDWGLAKPFGEGDRPERPRITRNLEKVDRFSTQMGEVTGTPHYMPPEQAVGQVDALGPHSDIYSLGAVLYELLTHEPPFDGPTVRAIREAVVNARLVPPSERAPEMGIHHELEQLCLHCLSKDPAHRPRGAAWVADQIDAFLEGEQDRARKAEERAQLLAVGEKAAEAYYARDDERRQLTNKAAVTRARMDPWAPVAQRRELWSLEDAVNEADIEAARSLSEALAAFHAALGVDNEHAPTRQALRDLYYSAFVAAERSDDPVQMAHYENLVRAFDDERTLDAQLQGDGALVVDRLPQRLSAELYTYVTADRVQLPINPRKIESTPTTIEPLPMGSYLLEVKAPGLSATHVPVYISRQERMRVRLRVFPDAVVGAGFVHIPGGPARLGGDRQAQLARPLRTEEVGDFFLARRPVAAIDYLRFLRALAEREGAAVALRRAPRMSRNAPPLWTVDSDGMPAIPERDAHGGVWHPEWPIVGVSCEDAEAFCRWMSDTSGEAHRLPTDVEWEKAARGADGRLFPWGDEFEATFCHMGISRDGPPSRGPVGEFPADVSPYGVTDLAGGVSEWTSTWLDEGARHRVIKGGHWASGPTECRAASRFSRPMDQVAPTVGFRIARDAP